ncbi:uncharacterized protein ACRADG_003401 isoform 1-T2 [Cochliomyia hominivorax]
MARGRNQNRGRNQRNTQIKNFPLNQSHQQQILQQQTKSVSVQQQQTKANSNTTTITTTSNNNQISNKSTIAPVANINKQHRQNREYYSKNTTSSSINSESYGHFNKTNNCNNNTNKIRINTKSNNYNSNRNNDAKINLNINEFHDNDDGEEVKTHLETNSDPAISSTTNTTYQMTMSNNSLENFSQEETNDEDTPADNNSGSPQEDHVDYNNDVSPLSHNYTNSANITESTQESVQLNMLNIGINEEHNNRQEIEINRSPVIGQNGSVIASLADNSNETNNSDKCLTATHNGLAVNGQLNELTECDRNRLLSNNLDKRDIVNTTAMGQKNTKGDNSNTSSNSASPTATPSASLRAFRESSIPSSSSVSAPLTSPAHEGYAGNNSTTNTSHTVNNNQQRGQSPSIHVPTITVVDCSSVGSPQTAKSYDSNKTDKDEFYDFDIETQQRQQQQHQQQHQEEFSDHNNENKEDDYACAVNGGVTQKVNSSYGKQQQPQHQRNVSPTSMYSRYNYIKLENVKEEDEEDLGEEEDEDRDEEEAEHAGREQQNVYNKSNSSNNNLDNEYQQQQHQLYKHTNSLSPERQQQQQHHTKSTNININNNNSNNNSDYNLSTSFPDSGMGESIASTTTNSQYINNNDTDCDAASSTMKQQQKQQEHDSEQDLQQEKEEQHQHQPFVRDGYSTDCDETLMQCDELLLDFAESPDYLDPASSERLVCIESISLPDVVVESTNSNGNSGTISTNNNAATLSSLSSNSGAERDYINVNGATGATLNSVHFIPIHVEGSSGNLSGSSGGGGSGRSSPRKQSVDDSLVGSSRASIEIIEDATELQRSPSSPRTTKNNSDIIAEKLKNDLLEQKAQFNVQLEDAHKNVNNLQTKVSEMQMKIEKLEQELSAKTWNVERLQGELNAAHKDDEYVRKKLKLLEDEKTNLRHRYSENEDELKRKYDDLEIQYNELQEKYKQTQSLASNLHTQLAKAQTEAEEWREELEKIRGELEEQVKVLKNALENSENERKICEDKWQREFEMLRTHNMEREESIMTDCEWQLRQMQKQCKERYDKAEKGRKEAEEKVEELEEELEERRKEIDDLKVYQAQVNSLRGVINEQEQSIQNLVSQIEHLKSDLAIANDNLAEQIEAVKKIKYHCDNALYDKERQMMYRIDEVRNEAACFWEDKLYTEMTRLKNELESVYVDERREALDKLQNEHIEELKALTNRYTDNEEELRQELSETQQLLEQKTQEFIELREKSDNALLQTRMHLDRADREYQKAMCQEEERREALENSLRQEFEKEKQEMEEKFRERLGQVKEEFAKELQINTQELKEEHKKEIQKLKVKMQAEKEEALQALTEKHKKKMADVDEKIKDIEQRHKHDLKDLKAAYDSEKASLDKRDISNANEIEQLHRKCRCLTNLFEEMRMRYERRDPRPEDLREIAELRARCESQERDLYLLTDRLREMQIQMNELQQNGVECNAMNNKNNKKSKPIKKPPPKTIPTNCDVIYEENEERESPPPTQNSIYNNNNNYNNEDDNDNDEDEKNDDDDDENEDDEAENDDNKNQENNKENTGDNDVKEQRIIDVKSKIDQSSHEEKNAKLLIKNNLDDSHMITAV